jgi:hypothetical protein
MPPPSHIFEQVARGAASQLSRLLGFLPVVTSSEIRPDGLGEHWREESFGIEMIAAPIVLDANAWVVGEINERNLFPCRVKEALLPHLLHLTLKYHEFLAGGGLGEF